MPLFTDICGAVDQFENTISAEIAAMTTHQHFLTAADSMSSGSTDMNLQLSGTLGTHVTGLLIDRLTLVEADMRRFSTMKGLAQNINKVHEVLKQHAKITAAIIRGSISCPNRPYSDSEQRFYRDTIFKKYSR
ncbi:hypothetical protein COB55_03555 [Candidatus Wolfebacteria bacterium]|nr:MAG: hypothetical protein COB55_03555 [Candidatus Wolfebacteria bacterium]